MCRRQTELIRPVPEDAGGPNPKCRNRDSSPTRQFTDTVFEDTSPTDLKTVHDTFKDSSPTKFYIVFIFGKLKECPYFDKMK